MTVINSTISHEMRNPLNSILSHNHVQKLLYENLKDWLERNCYNLEKDEVTEYESILDEFQEDT